MIDKTTINDYLFNKFMLLAAGGVSIQLLAQYNPMHAVLGAAGQIFAILATYVRDTNKGESVKKRPVIFWISCIILGAGLGYLFTTWMSKKIGWNEVMCSILLGALAQKAADMLDVFVEVIKKRINKDE